MQQFIEPAQDILNICAELSDMTIGPLNAEQGEFTETIARNTQRFIEQTMAFANYIALMQAGEGYFAIAHDWRTPLAPMVGYSDLLAEEMVGPLNNAQRDAYQRIYLHSIYLRDAVKALVDFAKNNGEQAG